MSRKPRKERKMNPIYFVFCEGETEAEYAQFLRSEYRLPIEIKTKISGTSISPALIRNSKRDYATTPQDRDFLMYDLDRDDVNLRLKSIRNATIIGSLPSIELWFLLHFEDVRHACSATDAERKLKQQWIGYEKGTLTINQQNDLRSRMRSACERAERLESETNPSSDIHRFIVELDRVKQQNQ